MKERSYKFRGSEQIVIEDPDEKDSELVIEIEEFGEETPTPPKTPAEEDDF